MAKENNPLTKLGRFINVVNKQSGKAVRPYRADGFVNMLTKYGTSADSSEHYEYEAEPTVDDSTIEMFYESNGLFARIIDAPAEEAVKKGFQLKKIEDDKIVNFCMESLEELDWEETAINCIKWTRLYGGAIAVLLVNDGKGLEEPLDWNNIKSIDDIRIYDRSLVQPHYNTMYHYDPSNPFDTRGSRLGTPERYTVMSKYGQFTVHESRCLLFQNGVLPERATNEQYQFWGMPEYIRIRKAVENTEIAHGMATKMLDRSVQAIYKMANLASELATEEGESRVLKRLQTIDLAKGLMNSIAIDRDGEEYDYRSFSFAGVSEVINTTCNYLSAISNIPQTVLFGRSPAGMNATGDGDMENYYNYVQRIQKRMLKSNLRYLLSIICQAGVATGEIKKVPTIQVEFNPLWSLTEAEEVGLQMQKVQIESAKAQVAATYVQIQAIDPYEVRKKLAEEGEFDVDTMLDDYTDEELFPSDNFPDGMPKFGAQQGGAQGADPMAAMMGGGAPQGGDPNADPMAAMMGGAPQEDPNGEPSVDEGEKKPDKKASVSPQEKRKPKGGKSQRAERKQASKADIEALKNDILNLGKGKDNGQHIQEN